MAKRVALSEAMVGDRPEIGTIARSLGMSTLTMQVPVRPIGGASRVEAAKAMGISPRTFDSHRLNILEAIGARNNAELAAIAVSHRLVNAGAAADRAPPLGAQRLVLRGLAE